MNNYYDWEPDEINSLMAAQHSEDCLIKYPKHIEDSVRNTISYSFPYSFFPATRFLKTEISVYNTTCVDRLRDEPKGDKIAIVNNADGATLGGGFLLGDMDDEAQLCHRSYLFNILKKLDPKPNFGYYIPYVIFDDRYACDIINIPKEESSDIKKIIANLVFILDMAANQKVDTLIISSLYTNVRDFGIYLKYILESYDGVFKEIHFAINNEINYNYYKEVFAK